MDERRWWAFAVLLAGLCAIALRLSWLGDDAYITLRSVENWARGNGLCWNTADRVQTYTHPLWMLVLAAGRRIGGDVYFTTITLSLALSAAAIALLLWRARTVPAMVATAAVLASAGAFVDYTTSGLETPLTYLLLVAFVACATGGGEPRRRFVRCTLLAALLTTNRMDLAVLCAPAVLAAARTLPPRRALVLGLAAGSPFLVWLGFAALYYGSPFPVTAHAKAFGIGIPAGEIAVQGLRYLWHAARTDPVLFAVALAGPIAACCGRRTRWLGAGALLYVGYVVKVGGDFMQGRFLLPPFVVSVAAGAPWLAANGWRAAAPVTLLALALLSSRGVPPFLVAPGDETKPTLVEIDAQHGIVDERRMHQHGLGLWSSARSVPEFGDLTAQAFPEGRERRWFLLNGSVGTAGFRAGALGHLIDPLLCDPLLTRLPARNPSKWRIGHVLRRVPEGYYETLASGENRLLHPGLRRYYDMLRTATRAPVFSGGRLATLWRAATGGFDAELRAFVAEHYFTPPRVAVAAVDLPPPLPLGTYWFDAPDLRVVYDGGVTVQFAEPVTARSLRLQAMGFCVFRCRFVEGGEVRGETVATPLAQPPELPPLRALVGLREERIDVPDAVAAFDELWLDAVEVPGSDQATGPPAVGALRGDS